MAKTVNQPFLKTKEPKLKTGPTRCSMALASAFFVSLFLVFQPLQAHAAGGYNQGKLLQPELLERNRTAPVRIIALLTGWEGLSVIPGGRDPEADLAARVGLAVLQDRLLEGLDQDKIRVAVRYDNLPALALEVAPGYLSSLLAAPGLALVEEDLRLSPGGDTGSPFLKGAEFQYASVSPEMKGAGVAIAFIDTGVDYSAVGQAGFPNNKILGGYDYGDNDPDPMDCSGHGTGMIRIATTWVAPEAKAYAFKICPGCCHKDPNWVSHMLKAWDWVLTNQHKDPAHPIMVVNVSWGNVDYMPGVCDKKYPAVAAAAARLNSAGIAVFAAAGNNGFCDGLILPACVSSVFSVGAVYQRNIGPKRFCVSKRACYKKSGKGKKCKTECVDETTAKDQVSCCSNSDDKLDLLAQSQGRTSGATAYASGVAAVIQGFHKRTRGRFLSVRELKQALIKLAEPIKDHRNGRVKPRLNIYQVYNRLGKLDWGVVSAR